MKKIFTFLVAFLTTVSGAVWGQTYPTAGSGSGTQDDPYILDLANPCDIGSGGWGGNDNIVEWHGGGGLGSYNAFQIKKGGDVDKNETVYYKVINSDGPDAVSSYCIEIDNGTSTSGLDVTLILDNVNILVGEKGEPHNGEGAIYIEENQGIFGGGDEHNVTIQLVGENHITYTTEGGGNGSAIWVNGDSNLTINGTGSLYATGYVGIGNHSGISGDITINGGTVVANGMGANGSGFGGTVEDGTNLNINGNTFVISNGSGNVNENFTKGIYYDSSEGDYIADVKDDVVLDSSYPSADEILGSELKFDILDGSTLTLGSGISFPTTRLANANDESKLKAYKVTYDLNKSVGENEDIQITNEADYVAIYAGANVDLAALPEDSRTDVPSWQAMAWGQNKGGTYAKVTKTGSTTPSTAVTNNQINATAIWAVDTWTDINVTQNETLDETIQLFYPQEAASLFTISNGTDLNQYGAALGTGDNANKVVAHTTGATASPNEQATNVELTISGDTKKIILPFKVNKDIPSFNDATITLKSEGRVYNSEPIKEVSEIISKIMVDGSEVAFTNVEMQFKKDNEGQEGDDLSSAPEEVGKYWVSVKAKAGATSYQGKSKYVQFEITPKTVTVKSVADEVYTINGDGTFDWSDNVTLEGLIDGDNVTIKYNGTPEGSDYVDTPGTYTVSYTISKEGDDAGNYTIPESATGKLIVKKTGNDDDPIKPGDPDDDETEIKIEDGEGGWEWSDKLNGYYRTYDAESHPLNVANTIYVKQKDAENGDWVAVPADAIKVSYTFTEEQTETEQNPYTGAIKDAGDYVASITIDGDELGDSGVLYSGEADDIKLFILPFDLNIAIKQLDASFIGKTTNITADLVTVTETLPKEEVPSYSGSIKVSEDANENGTYDVTFTDIKLVDAEGFNASNYNAKFTYNGKALSEVTETEIPDITPGEDTDIDDGDGDGNEWTWNGESYEVVYDGKPHGISSVTITPSEGLPTSTTSVNVSYTADDETASLGGQYNEPLTAGHYTATVVVLIEGTEKTGTFPLWIKERPLRVDFNLTNLDESAIGATLYAEDYVSYESNGDNEGLVDDQTPDVSGTFQIANTPNDNGKYDISAKDVTLVNTETFAISNYEPKYYVNGELLTDNDQDGVYEGDIDGDDGADINDDSIGGGSPINTKQYRLYLANKDYNVVDAKADYAAEGLELFSRHDKKYTKAGGSFTVWYEKDGVANAGGYRIFWSNRANGDYKEVKFDSVSEYFQIRNVQSNVYVKIYAADGFPVGNEEISAADYRAYAQPNKIVVITPQPTDVQIISMAGAVVATDKVTGQREFTNLTEGVYIVRMGETVVKLQVRK